MPALSPIELDPEPVAMGDGPEVDDEALAGEAGAPPEADGAELERMDDLGMAADERGVVEELAALMGDAGRDDCWEVDVTQRCQREWRKLGAPLQLIVLHKLRELVSGREERTHETNRAKWLKHRNGGLNLFESWMGRRGQGKAFRLLWEEVWVWSGRFQCWRDRILLWGPCHKDEINRAIRQIVKAYKKREAVEREAPPPSPPERQPSSGGIRRPRRLDAGREQLEPREAPPFDPDYTLGLEALAIDGAVGQRLPAPANETGTRSQSNLVIRDKAVLKDIRDRACKLARQELSGRGQEPLQFGMSEDIRERHSRAIEQECAIICADGPIAVIGRSGTGKTACALARIWSRYHAYFSVSRGARLFESTSSLLRIVYITTNPMLLKKVRRDFTMLEPEHILLAPQNPAEQAGADGQQQRDAMAMPGERGEVGPALLGSGDADLCDSLVDVRDHAYPLFVTGRKWLDLVDGTLERPFFPRGEDGRITGRPGIWVDGEFFAAELWGDLVQRRRGDGKAQLPHPQLVWTEFMSLIAGSAESLKADGGSVDLGTYQRMGRNRSRLASEEERALVHELHGQYRKMKEAGQLFDVTDVVRHIYLEVKAGRYRSVPIHELIVDEVQDFTGAELGLMATLVSDLGGLFFCGDTCQTVARGLAFRICDLQSIPHHLFGAADRKIKLKHLSLNYRSHDGILACAAVCVDMLLVLFPKEIDELPRDRGLRSGLPPMLFRASDERSLTELLFGTDPSSENAPACAFGPDQVVIVRSVESARRVQQRAQLQRLLHDSIVLTVEEAKGLEFEEVLLFNFFTDGQAPAESQLQQRGRTDGATTRARMWKAAVERGRKEVVSRAGNAASNLGEAGPSSSHRGMSAAAAIFDPYANRLVATELKHLYTSLTRAKTAVWIFDEDEKARKPMFNLLTEAQVVRSVEKGDASVRGVTLSKAYGTAEQWRRRGLSYYEARLFEQAELAFRKAGDTRMARVARAELECAAAEAVQNKAKRKAGLQNAAELFKEAGESLRAADCYEAAGDREKACSVGGLPWMDKWAANFLSTSDSAAEVYKTAADTLRRHEAEAGARDDSNMGGEPEELHRRGVGIRARVAELLGRAASVGFRSQEPPKHVQDWARQAVVAWMELGSIYASASTEAFRVFVRCQDVDSRNVDVASLPLLQEAAQRCRRDRDVLKRIAEIELAVAGHVKDAQERKNCLLHAAQLFEDVGETSRCADCYESAGDREKAFSIGGLPWMDRWAETLLSNSDSTAEVYKAAGETLMQHAAQASQGQDDSNMGREQETLHELGTKLRARAAELLGRAAAVGQKAQAPLEQVQALARQAVETWMSLSPRFVKASIESFRTFVQVSDASDADPTTLSLLREAAQRCHERDVLARVEELERARLLRAAEEADLRMRAVIEQSPLPSIGGPWPEASEAVARWDELRNRAPQTYLQHRERADAAVMVVATAFHTSAIRSKENNEAPELAASHVTVALERLSGIVARHQPAGALFKKILFDGISSGSQFGPCGSSYFSLRRVHALAAALASEDPHWLLATGEYESVSLTFATAADYIVDELLLFNPIDDDVACVAVHMSQAALFWQRAANWAPDNEKRKEYATAAVNLWQLAGSRRDPQAAEAYRVLARAHEERGELDEALEAARLAADADPTEEAFLLLGSLQLESAPSPSAAQDPQAELLSGVQLAQQLAWRALGQGHLGYAVRQARAAADGWRALFERDPSARDSHILDADEVRFAQSSRSRWSMVEKH
eukprot:tig00000939_g5486.t1